MNNKNKWKLILFFLLNNFCCRLLFFLLYQNYNILSFLELSLSLLIVIHFWSRDLKNYFKSDEYKSLVCQKISYLDLRKNIVLAGIISFSVIIYYCFFHKLKLIYIFQEHLEMYDYLGLISFVIQILYFIIEIVSMVVVINCVPVNKIPEKLKIECGGLLLAITWGVSHFITGSSLTGKVMTDFTWSLNVFNQYSLFTGLYYVILSLLITIIFVVFKNNFKYVAFFSGLLYLI